MKKEIIKYWTKISNLIDLILNNGKGSTNFNLIPVRVINIYYCNDRVS